MAGKRLIRKRHWYTIFHEFFLSAEGGDRSFDKSGLSFDESGFFFPSIYLFLKPLSSKLRSLPAKRIRVQFKACVLMTLSHRSFFQPISARLFPTNSRSITALSILMILLDKCQTSCFEDMNILIKARLLNF